MGVRTGDVGRRRGVLRRRWVMAAAALAAVVPVSVAGGSPATAGVAGPTITVTTDAADGPGSLLAAFDTASTDRAVRRIQVAPGVASGTITPARRLVYTGQQNLVFDGNGVTIDGQNSLVAGNGDPGVDVGIELATAADVTFREIALEGAVSTGIRLEATGAQRAVRFRLFDVAIDSSQSSVEIRDNREGRGTYLIANRLNVTRGVVGIDMSVTSATASIDMRNSTIDTASVGVGMGQTGNGSAIAKLVNVDVATDSFGISFSESGNGDIRVNATNVTAIGAVAFGVSESDAGHLRATLTNVEITALSLGTGLFENGEGNLITRIRNLRINDGSSTVFDALRMNELGAGRLDATISKMNIDGPLGGTALTGVDAEQEAPGNGRVRLSGSNLCGAFTPTEFDGIARVAEFNNLSGLACLGT